MTNASDISFWREQYEQRGYTLLTDQVPQAFIRALAQLIEEATSSQFVEGDDSDHSWKEISLRPPKPPDNFLPGAILGKIIGSEPASMEQWLNVFGEGEFIETHFDAGGDAQLLIPVDLPDPTEGGQLWIDEKNNLLPIGLGDVLIFAARRLRHGTTPVLCGRRVSFNCRLWLN